MKRPAIILKNRLMATTPKEQAMEALNLICGMPDICTPELVHARDVIVDYINSSEKKVEELEAWTPIMDKADALNRDIIYGRIDAKNCYTDFCNLLVDIRGVKRQLQDTNEKET